MESADLKACIDLALKDALQDHFSGEAFNQAIQTAVDKAVNGKINKLTTDMAPFTLALAKWKLFRGNMVFFIGVVLAVGGAIQAGQAIWGVITHYFSISLR